MSKTFVTGLFKTRAAAEAAVDAIIKRGYTRDDVSVMMSDATRNKDIQPPTYGLSMFLVVLQKWRGCDKLDINSRKAEESLL